MKVDVNEKRPIKMWLDDIEEGAMAQARNLANLPFVFKHIALMPDAHQGYGMPIGGVMATKGVVVPNAVGVDIGCGMCAVRTSLTGMDTDSLKRIMGEVRKAIPVGFNRHKESQGIMPDLPFSHAVLGNMDVAGKSMGTLGGGNHFIEFQKGNDGYIWIVIHSGSRNLGKQVADCYNKVAIKFSEMWYSEVPKEWQLAFLSLESDLGTGYIEEMNYCVEYARLNRGLMMERIKNRVADEVGGVSFEDTINIAHNYAVMEHHFGKNVMVHRKGATSAREGQLGIIPGSQGTTSYIVKGKGEKESFMSCSHGAGRRMGRKQAERELDLNAEKKRLDDMGVIHSIRTEKDLDEAAGAYKDIGVVMANQTDLVDVVVELKPLGVIKG
jgi:tRNA-splicing ligase RtcB